MENIDKRFILIFFTLTVLVSSCKKYLEIPPPKSQVTPKEIFENDASATSTITGIYSRMQGSSGGYSGSSNSITALAGLTSDELKAHSPALDVFYKNEIPTSNSTISLIWAETYKYIYTANAVLDGLKSSSEISPSINDQLQGEAKFIRAFCYFYLVNLFGEVPLNLTSKLEENRHSPKSSIDKIYSQIVADLNDAENLLPSNYISNERIRPNKWTASAMLARVYLYMGRWELSIQKASSIIGQTPMYSLNTNLDQVFLKNSTEAIWQLMPEAGFNTKEGALFILSATPTNVSLSPSLMPLFDNGDNRKVQWTAQFTNTTGTYYYLLIS